MTQERKLQSISDDELLRRLADLLRQSRRVESDPVAHIGEVDERRLYAREGSSSLFHYCVETLHFSEAEAYLRIAAARASRIHPMLLTMLADGRLHLSGVAKIAPHLNEANRETVLARASHKSKRQIEEPIAEVSPKPDLPGTMRKLPVRLPETPSSPSLQLRPLRPDAVKNETPVEKVPIVQSGPPVPPAVAVQPFAPARYKVTFTASAELYGCTDDC